MDNKTVDHEQWLSYGDCRICRKAEYCGHICSARKKTRKRLIGALPYALAQIEKKKKEREKEQTKSD